MIKRILGYLFLLTILFLFAMTLIAEHEIKGLILFPVMIVGGILITLFLKWAFD